MPAHSPRLATSRAASLLLGGALLFSGCVTAPGGAGVEIQWPLPPDKPRVKFLRSITSAADLPAGLWVRIKRAFVPPPPDANVKQPTGLALSNDEKRLYVTSASESRVLEIELSTGTIRTVATAEGRSPNNPFSVALDAADNLYVSDFGTDSIWVYASNGTFLRRISNERLQRPTGIAIDRERQVLYAVCGVRQKSQTHRVEAFSLQGEPIRTIGTRGAAPGQFNFPTNVAIDRQGNLHVVDMLNFRVQVFDPEGNFVSTFGSIGAGQPGTFDKAKGLAFDAFGNLHVTDSQQGFVQIFSPRYQPLMAYGGRAELPGYMAVPTAIAIDSKNTIYVADFAKGKVNIYEMVNTTAEDSFPEPPPSTAPAQPAQSAQPTQP